MRCDVCGCRIPKAGPGARGRCPECGTRLDSRMGRVKEEHPSRVWEWSVLIPVGSLVLGVLLDATALYVLSILLWGLWWFLGRPVRKKKVRYELASLYPHMDDGQLLDDLIAKELAVKTTKTGAWLVCYGMVLLFGVAILSTAVETPFWKRLGVGCVFPVMWGLTMLAVGLLWQIVAGFRLSGQKLPPARKRQGILPSPIGTLFSVAFLVIGLTALVAGVLNSVEYYTKVVPRLVKVEAVITRISVYTDSEGDTDHDAYVTYTHDGIVYEDVKLSHYSSDMRKGDSLTVELDPQNPEKPVSSPIWIIPMGAVFALIGGVLTHFTLTRPILRYRKERSTPMSPG